MLIRHRSHYLTLLLLVFSLSALVTSCGFKLRGEETLPFKYIYLEGDPQSSLYLEVRRALRNTSSQVATDRNKSDVVLILRTNNRERQVISLNPQGQIRELRLSLQTQFALIRPNGDELIAPTDISLTRDLTYSETTVLAKQTEEGTLYRDMEQDAAQQIIRRVAAFKVTAISQNLPATSTPSSPSNTPNIPRAINTPTTPNDDLRAPSTSK